MTLPPLPDFHRITNVSPAWWGAVAGAATAGAVLFPEHRLLGGALVGGAMLVIALYKTPCCAGCGAASSPTATAARDAAAGPELDPVSLLQSAALARGATGCAS
jgi:hypothetical protein